MGLAALTVTPGFFAFGYLLSIEANAILCVFCQGLLMVGVVVGIWSTLSYGLDAFRDQSSDTFVMVMIFKVRRPPPTRLLSMCSI